jgi:hypothetical protein
MRQTTSYVIKRENNILRVDFSREPDPPAPKFPGAGAMHKICLEGEEELAPASYDPSAEKHRILGRRVEA